MKLNADIVFENLLVQFEAEMIGTPSKALSLQRPIFYMALETKFDSNHLYVASADHLPTHPTIEKDVVLVCLGDSLQLSYYTKRCTVIRIKGKQDIFAIYLSIQRTFDRYDAWNDELFSLFKADADIQKIVSCSSSVFEEPIVVLDSDFRFIASAGHGKTGLPEIWKDRRENLSTYAIDHFLSENDLHIGTRDPMFLEIVDSNALCVNLFDSADRYIGCLVILVAAKQPRPGLDAVTEYLARIVERSLEKNPSLLATERNARKGVLQDLLDGRPIGPNQQSLLEPSGEPAFLCVSVHTYSKRQALPQRFIESSFEIAFPGSYALAADDVVAGIIDLEALGCSPKDYRHAVDERLTPLLDSLKLYAGVSNDFSELRDTPVYFRQAVHTFENGSLMNTDANCFYFADYALTEMVINSLSGAPIETFFPYEFRELLKHDAVSSVSFLETLEVILANNLNYSKAAEILFVHRSTLIDRVERIEKRFGIDLQNPDSRLLLQLLIKGIRVEHGIKNGPK